MVRFIKIDIRSRARTPIVQVLSAVLTVAIMIGLLIVLLPLIGLIVAIMLGVALGLALVGVVWWLIRGRRIWKQMQQDLGRQETADRPSKKIDVTIHED